MISLAFISNLLGPQGGLILLALVFLFGAKKLPELGRSIGETVREFSKSREEREEEERQKLNEKRDV